MQPMFCFQVDTVRSLVRVTLSGFFTPEDVARFERDRNIAHRSLRCGPNQHLTLVDIREMQVQSQQAVAAFETVVHNPAYYSRRIAVVTTKSLTRSQIRRAAHDREVGYFDTIAEAEAWLFGVEAKAA